MEGDDVARIEGEAHVVVAVGRRRAVGHPEAARHAEVDQHRAAVVEAPDHQLAAPVEFEHPPPDDALAESLGHRAAQIRPPDPSYNFV